MTEMNDLTKKLAEDLTKEMNEIKAALKKDDAPGDPGFVIKIGILYVSVSTEGRVIKDLPHRLPKFTAHKASQIAKRTKNGNGETGEAVHWRKAAADFLAEAEKLIGILNNKG